MKEQIIAELPKESQVHFFLKLRDVDIEMVEYRDESGYGSKKRIFLMHDYKHESVCVEFQLFNAVEWMVTNEIEFDSDSYEIFANLIKGVEQPETHIIKEF